jgi:hypothetical protein
LHSCCVITLTGWIVINLPIHLFSPPPDCESLRTSDRNILLLSVFMACHCAWHITNGSWMNNPERPIWAHPLISLWLGSFLFSHLSYSILYIFVISYWIKGRFHILLIFEASLMTIKTGNRNYWVFVLCQ